MNLLVRTAAFFVAITIVPTAFAHALLDHANPRVGSTVTSAPKEVQMWFTEKLEPAFSNAEVRNAKGQPVSGKSHVDNSDRTKLHVPVKALAAGTYTVRWHVLSVDTHRTQGNFTFRVNP
jgi:copper resistance protein C